MICYSAIQILVTSSNAIYGELGWAFPSKRSENLRLFGMHKIVHRNVSDNITIILPHVVTTVSLV